MEDLIFDFIETKLLADKLNLKNHCLLKMGITQISKLCFFFSSQINKVFIRKWRSSYFFSVGDQNWRYIGNIAIKINGLPCNSECFCVVSPGPAATVFHSDAYCETRLNFVNWQSQW